MLETLESCSENAVCRNYPQLPASTVPDIRKVFSESTLHQWPSCPAARLVCLSGMSTKVSLCSSVPSSTSTMHRSSRGHLPSKIKSVSWSRSVGCQICHEGRE